MIILKAKNFRKFSGGDSETPLARNAFSAPNASIERIYAKRNYVHKVHVQQSSFQHIYVHFRIITEIKIKVQASFE